MEIRPLLPDALVRQLENHDTQAVARTLESARRRPDGILQVLRGMRRFAGQHAVRPGEWPAIVVLDAVGDLVPACEGQERIELLRAAAGYLLGIPTGPLPVERLDPVQAPSDVVPVSLLEDALAAGDLGAVCRALSRLAGVIRSHEAFLELLLQAAAADRTASGRRWVHTSACVKALNDLPLDEGRGLLLRWAEDLVSPPIPRAPVVADTPASVPVRAGFEASLTTGVAADLWPPLAHAFQGERYAETRRTSVRAGLRRWIAECLFDGDSGRMEDAQRRLSTSLDKAAGEAAELPDLEGRALAERIGGGDPSCVEEAGRWASSLEDVDRLFRWLAIAIASRLESGDGETIVTVNAARWGAHLLGSRGAGRITTSLVGRLVGTGSGER